MWCVPLVRTDDSVERVASIITLTRISELGITLSVFHRMLQLLVTADVIPNTHSCHSGDEDYKVLGIFGYNKSHPA
jgi:hypothetical protein